VTSELTARANIRGAIIVLRIYADSLSRSSLPATRLPTSY
jgi:hypothetical protein